MMSHQQHQMPQTHIGLTQRSWERIREGLRRCREDPDARQRCVAWCRKFPECTQLWIEILQEKHEDLVEQALSISDYEMLPVQTMAWWERIIQNHPFERFLPESDISNYCRNGPKNEERHAIRTIFSHCASGMCDCQCKFCDGIRSKRDLALAQ